MCIFITATLPLSADLDGLRPIFAAYKKGLELIHNPCMEKQLPVGVHYGLLSKGGCDCNTALGSDVGRSHKEKPLEVEVARLRRKGWSDARIQRWRDDKEAAIEHRKQRHHERDHEQFNTAEDWRAFIIDVVMSQYTHSFGLMIHMYGGSIKDEQFSLKRIEKFTARNVDESVLTHMEEDVLYLFAR